MQVAVAGVAEDRPTSRSACGANSAIRPVLSRRAARPGRRRPPAARSCRSAERRRRRSRGPCGCARAGPARLGSTGQLQRLGQRELLQGRAAPDAGRRRAHAVDAACSSTSSAAWSGDVEPSDRLRAGRVERPRPGATRRPAARRSRRRWPMTSGTSPTRSSTSAKTSRPGGGVRKHRDGAVKHGRRDEAQACPRCRPSASPGCRPGRRRRGGRSGRSPSCS